MLKEYLAAHPLRSLLCDELELGFEDVAWDGADASIHEMIVRYRSVEYPLLTAAQYAAFARSGDRAVFERPYFLRRRKLIAALMGCLTGDAPADLDALIDGLWLICEESTWVVSAHNGGEHAGVEPTPPRALPDVERPYVDLFSAQTAMILSLTCRLAKGIPPLVRQRVQNEIERRVLVPFETRDDFWWMGFIRKDLCNWTPWIVSNVMLTACVWIDDRDRLCALLERGCGMLDRYLDSLPGDGSCDEGPGYWSMAGGALLDCLELLERVTGGRLSFWEDKKLRNILRFPLNTWLGGDWFMNFADCDAKPDIPGERLQFAGEKLGDPALTAFGARFRGDPARLIEDTPQLWRLLNELTHAHVTDTTEPLPPDDVWMPDLEVRILCRDGLTLVCKGGVNEGSHNHNDCGSFMVLVDGAPQIVDAGNMTYTGATFSDKRYTLWNTRSAYHNVPLIGGFEQVNGWDRCAKDVRADACGLSMDLRNAYPEAAGLRAFARELRLEGGAVVLHDAIETDAPQPVTEVFLMRYWPGMRILPGEAMDMAVEEIPVVDPRMSKSFPGSLWRLTLTAPAAQNHSITIRIERGPA